MNPSALNPADFVARLVTLLAALFGATARCVARLRGMRGRVREGFARLAKTWMERGHALAYLGENDATVDARIARMEWIARDPVKALRHLARRARGFVRALKVCATVAPVSFAPPSLPTAPLCAGAEGSAPAPET
jgi:hypothetical protein